MREAEIDPKKIFILLNSIVKLRMYFVKVYI